MFNVFFRNYRLTTFNELRKINIKHHQRTHKKKVAKIDDPNNAAGIAENDMIQLTRNVNQVISAGWRKIHQNNVRNFNVRVELLY